MGQYYRAVLENKDGVRTVYNRDVNGEYTLAKLMEHSWWYNTFVNTICKLIFRNPQKVYWVGDYAEDLCEFYDEVWGENVEGEGVEEAQVVLSHKYLVNHDRKEYLDCSEYFKESSDEHGWCIHPLPLLTCVGNGRGGGDYRSDVNEDEVGEWYGATLSVETTIPEGYTKYEVVFKED